MIDPHVHLRDWEQRDAETILHGLKIAKELGYTDLFDMPNTKPPLTSRENIERRLEDASAAESSTGIHYHLYGGLTLDEREIEEMVSSYNDLFPRVIGLKMFFAQSTGNMGITHYEEQMGVFKRLSDLSYDGVVVVHAEKEDLFHPELYNPKDVKTHSLSRPPESEVESIRDAIDIIDKTSFGGHLHIAHISTKEGIELVDEAKREGFRISMGATPHHALHSFEDGCCLKMNPPLRSEEDRRYVFDSILNGKIDWIESDHAPHTKEAKERGASGIPALYMMPVLINELKRAGLEDERLFDITEGNIRRVFSI